MLHQLRLSPPGVSSIFNTIFSNRIHYKTLSPRVLLGCKQPLASDQVKTYIEHCDVRACAWQLSHSALTNDHSVSMTIVFKAELRGLPLKYLAQIDGLDVTFVKPALARPAF